MLILLYPPYPFPYPIEWYFEKRGFKRAFKEFKLVKQVLYIVVPLLIIFTVFGILPQFHPHNKTFTFVNYLLLFIVIAGLLKIVCALARSEFWLCYAIGCFVLMQDAKNEVEEMKFYIMGLKSYNSYLRRKINLQIKDLEKVHSKIAASTIEQKNIILGKFALFFLPGRELDNIFYPLIEISKILETTETDLLVEEPIINKVRGWGAAAAVIIPVAIQLIAFFNKTAWYRLIFGG